MGLAGRDRGAWHAQLLQADQKKFFFRENVR